MNATTAILVVVGLAGVGAVAYFAMRGKPTPAAQPAAYSAPVHGAVPSQQKASQSNTSGGGAWGFLGALAGNEKLVGGLLDKL